MKSVAEALSLYIFKFQGMCWLNVQRRKQKQKQDGEVAFVDQSNEKS
jgi:hypothetical protein